MPHAEDPNRFRYHHRRGCTGYNRDHCRCCSAGSIGRAKADGGASDPPAGKGPYPTGDFGNDAWGWFDNAELPRLTIDSGDTVVFETMSHSHGQLWPGRTIDELKKLRTDWPGRGPMTITGPVFVNTAEPGDVLQIKINKIVGRPWGANFNVPGLFGQFPKEFPDGQVKYFYLDWERKVAEFGPGIEIPLRPFPGTLGVARAQPGRYN